MGVAIFPGGELLPVFVTSDLQAARDDFAKPAPANLVHCGPSVTPDVRGGAFILAGVHYHVLAAGSGVGFTLKQVVGATETVLFSIASAGAQTMSRSTQMWRPLAGPSLGAGPAAVDGGSLKLELIGAPASGSFLEVELWHHFDRHYGARFTVLSPVDGDAQL